MATKLKTRIRHKIDTEERWIFHNPILRKGEIGFTSDGEHKNWFKLGDGETPWTGLQYAYSEFIANLISVDNLTIEMTENGIAIKDTGVVSGSYGSYDEADDIYNIPSFTVNSKGQITQIKDQRVQIKQTMNVIPVEGEYTIQSNNSLIAGKATAEAACVVNVPSGLLLGTQVIIKNTASEYALVVRPVNSSIDNFSGDIILAPYEYITLVCTSSTDWSIISESSRFDTTKLALLKLDSNVIVRTDTLGNIDENISLMNLEQEHIAIV